MLITNLRESIKKKKKLSKGCWLHRVTFHILEKLKKKLCHDIYPNPDSGNYHQIEWNIKITAQNIKRMCK